MSTRKIIEHIKKGNPIYLEPYREPKIWGIKGIGEYWYGAYDKCKSAKVKSGRGYVLFHDLIKSMPEEIIGKAVIKKFGPSMPLVKILTPKSRLSVQFHDMKNELWIVTAINRKIAGAKPSIILGFSKSMIKKHGQKIKSEYGESLKLFGAKLNVLFDELERSGMADLLKKKSGAIKAARKVRNNETIKRALKDLILAKKNMEKFYGVIYVKEGDILPVPKGTLHALGPGIEVVEPQIAGPTQSLEDGDTYPVRYYFPGYQRGGATRELDIYRVNELLAGVYKRGKNKALYRKSGVKIDSLPGGFEKKGLAVNIISLKKNKTFKKYKSGSFHIFSIIKGKASIYVNGNEYGVPEAKSQASMLVLPASSKMYSISAKQDSRLIDVFSPIS